MTSSKKILNAFFLLSQCVFVGPVFLKKQFLFNKGLLFCLLAMLSFTFVPSVQANPLVSSLSAHYFLNPTSSKVQTTPHAKPICVFIASYALDYVWQVGINAGLLPVISPKCDVRIFYMDTKNQRGKAYRIAQGQKAKAFIEANHPDVVIVSDDNAVKYVLQPYFKNSKIPFVFCGVNDTGKPYGLPYRNTTGIIERTEYSVLMNYAFQLSLGKRTIAYLSADEVTAQKNEVAFVKMAKRLGLRYEVDKVTNFTDWKKAFLSMQNDPRIDFIVLGNFTSLAGYKDPKLKQFVFEHTRKVTASLYTWIMPYAVFGVVKLPEEQGRWAGEAALAILKGYPPTDIPVVPNRRFQLVINTALVKKLNLTLPPSFIVHALEVKK